MTTFFTKYYDVLMAPLERKYFNSIRKQLLKKATGQVLEIGSGTGVNFLHYVLAEEVTAIEPESSMVAKSLSRAEKAAVPIRVIKANAERLPFTDHAFDTVVGTLVLCTIPEPNKALNEIRRVCRPGGSVLFFEHGRLNHSFFGALQDMVTPAWKRLCGGCHLNRNPVEMIKRAGFKIVRIEKHCHKLFVVVEAVNKSNT